MSSGFINEGKYPCLCLTAVDTTKARVFITDVNGVVRPATEGCRVYSSEIVKVQAIAPIDYLVAYKVNVAIDGLWWPVMGVTLGDPASRWRKDRFVVKGTVEFSYFEHSLLGES